MATARTAYAALIRAPLIGPVARLPLRSVRWLLQPPDLDPSARADHLAAELVAVKAQLANLVSVQHVLRLDQERLRLMVLMLCGQAQRDPQREQGDYGRREQPNTIHQSAAE